MKNMNSVFRRMLSVLLCLILFCVLLPTNVWAAQSGDYIYKVSGGKATITSYRGNAKKVTIPSKLGGYPVTAIGDDAFVYTNVTNVTVPEGVVSIGDFTFSHCYISTISLPKSLTAIGEHCFWESMLSKITIPAAVTYIGDKAFCECSKLSSITVASGNQYYTTSGGALYNKNMTRLIAVPGAFSGCLVIPSGVTTISSEAAYWCEKLTGVVLPLSVRSIEEGAFSDTALKTVYYYGTRSNRSSISIDNTYSGNQDLLNATWIYSFKGFIDVVDPSAYYYDAVYWARGNGITTGKTPTTFQPNGACTRGQIVTFLWRMMGQPAPASTGNPFKDVKSGDYYYTAVLWAYHRGITTGKTATSFQPNGTCTREQSVTFLWRAAGKPGSGGGNPFGDVKAGTYYYDAVRWAVANGITTGRTDTVFGVGQKCTRAQIVTFLYRYSH